MSNSLKRTAILVVALLPVLVLGYFAFPHNDTTSPSSFAGVPSAKTNENTNIPPPTTAVIVSTPVSVYADGTFVATGSYTSPGGSDALSVTLTLKDDTVVAVSLVVKPSNPVSKEWQDTFASGYKVFVVGKKLSDLRLANVSGSSLTPIGFNDALDQIRIQAKAV